METRKVLEVIRIAPGESDQFARRYDSKNRTKWDYSIDVPEDVRHMVDTKRVKTGTAESGQDQLFIHNRSSCLAVVTIFEFEE
jgi:hypothetical protein